jgi:uncharacterized protein (TIGR02246 family)
VFHIDTVEQSLSFMEGQVSRSRPSVHVLAIIAVLLFSNALSSRAVAQPSGADEEAIKRIISAMDEAFNAHQPDVSLFARDADFVNVNGTWLKGASNIESGRRSAFETRLKNARTKSLDVRVRFVRPDVAIVHVTSETAGITASDGRELPPQRELNIRVFVKEEGRWLVTAFQNTPLRP